MPIELELPAPWAAGTRYTFDDPHGIMWLVGPNGTGKSRILRALKNLPSLGQLRPRLLSTDRVAPARHDEISGDIWGRRVAAGLPKNQFQQFITYNDRDGNILGTVALLHGRSDLRIRVEATLSQLLNRQIRLEMTDGNLTPKVRLGSAHEYAMFSDECHGVLELIVLLSNIYDSDTHLLLLDEPEQHLHPQYQAFVLDELQRAGKAAVIATHSPSFLSVRSLSDLQKVVCLHPDFRLPSRYRATAAVDSEVQEILPRMTEQHRAFFFATSPVFVEGYFDTVALGAIQRALGLTAEAAGSCLIPCLGKDEASRYLMLCQALEKRAVFVFDLDALFDRRLREGANQNEALAQRLAQAGHGELTQYVGALQRELSDAVNQIEQLQTVPPALAELRAFFAANAGGNNLDKRRIATLVAIAEQPGALQNIVGVENIRGRLHAILDHLATVDIHVLSKGALENYLPSYTGNRFKVPDDAKRQVALAEQAWLAGNPGREAVIQRYGELAGLVQKLPSRPHVDLHPTLQRELANVLHRLIMAIRAGEVDREEQIPVVVGEDWRRIAGFVELRELDIRSREDFSGTLVIQDKFGLGELLCRFSHETQTNNPDALVLELPMMVTR